MKTRKKGLIVFFAVALLFSFIIPVNHQASADTPRGNEVNVDVMSFNIAHGRGMDGVMDLERIATEIEESGAEIIGLQEVDRHWSDRSDFEDQAKWLAERLDMHYVYGANLDREPLEEGDPNRQYGTAVLSEYPIIDSQNHLLTLMVIEGEHNEQRGLLETVINVKGNHIRFFNTHLGLKEVERLVNIQEIFDIVDEDNKPSIIVGDFNAYPGDEEIDLMEERFDDVFVSLGLNDAYTFPAPYVDPETGEVTEPNARIDYIFSDKDLEYQNARVIHTSVSDHLPILIEFTLDRSRPYENGR
ncbi:endonuclease/exonuclease/phosphatase family protein [Alteribacter keqinensis]|nr:endonuclease/exonuclease/phosphatase family protein [Alteribacter keqinensis]